MTTEHQITSAVITATLVGALVYAAVIGLKPQTKMRTKSSTPAAMAFQSPATVRTWNEKAYRELCDLAVVEVIAQREGIIRAFIATHGCLPEHAIQIVEHQPDGGTRWYVRRMTEEEIAKLKS